MPEAWKWWYVYGPFREGMNGLPHTGDVIKYYRKLRSMSIEQFAEAYGCTVDHAWKLEGPKNMSKPINPGKRQLLVSTLGLPAALLGVGGLVPNTSTKHGSWSDEQEILCDDLLSASWHIFYTGDFQATTRNISLWLYMLEHSAAGARGADKVSIQVMWTKYLQLSTAVLRDREQEDAAIIEATKAVTLSRELGNTELLVGSLHQRFRVYEQLEQYPLALADTEEMLRAVKVGGVSDVLAGTAYLNAGEVLTNLAKTDKSLQARTLHLYDQAARVARALESDAEPPIGARFGLSKVMTERALAVRHFGQPKGAMQDLEVAKAHMPKTNIRWSKDTTLAEADIKTVAEDFRGALTLAQIALQVHLDTNSRSDYYWLRRIAKGILSKQPKNTEARSLLLSVS